MEKSEERVPVGRVLARRNFWPYLAGNLLSSSGTWFQNIAQVLLVYRLTGSSFLVGVVNFSQFAAIIFLAPIAGNAADRFDRRRLVVATQISASVLAASLAVITAAGAATPAIVIGIALALGVTLALSTPALQAIVPSLVPRAEMPAAVALTAVSFNLSRALGPVTAVLVIARFDIAMAFALNSLSYLALVAAMFAIRDRGIREPVSSRPRLRDSLTMVRSSPALFAPLLVVGLVSLSADPVNTLTPAFSTEVYGRPDTFTGWLVGAFGAGAVVAALTVSGKWTPSYRLIVVTLAMLGGGIATFALSSNEAVGVVALFVAGVGFLSSVTASTSLLHLEIGESHRGRVMALWSLSFHGSRPIGSLVDGALASLATIHVAGLVMAGPAFVGSLGLLLRLVKRKVRTERRT